MNLMQKLFKKMVSFVLLFSFFSPKCFFFLLFFLIESRDSIYTGTLTLHGKKNNKYFNYFWVKCEWYCMCTGNCNWILSQHTAQHHKPSIKFDWLLARGMSKEILLLYKLNIHSKFWTNDNEISECSFFNLPPASSSLQSLRMLHEEIDKHRSELYINYIYY